MKKNNKNIAIGIIAGVLTIVGYAAGFNYYLNKKNQEFLGKINSLKQVGESSFTYSARTPMIKIRPFVSDIMNTATISSDGTNVSIEYNRGPRKRDLAYQRVVRGLSTLAQDIARDATGMDAAETQKGKLRNKDISYSFEIVDNNADGIDESDFIRVWKYAPKKDDIIAKTTTKARTLAKRIGEFAKEVVKESKETDENIEPVVKENTQFKRSPEDPQPVNADNIIKIRAAYKSLVEQAYEQLVKR